MKIPFDKIYIISYIHNIENQIQKKEYLNNVWNVNFDFIYGINTNDLKYIFDFSKIQLMTEDNEEQYNIGHISCVLAHYTAIEHALVNNYNSCLIIEDDSIFTDDLNYIEYCFNNMPKDANCCRFGLNYRDEEEINKINDFWIANENCLGTQCYSFNNRDAMIYYLNQIKHEFTTSDVPSLFMPNYYSLKTLICKDPNSPLKIKE